jgi:hypothetical protein
MYVFHTIFTFWNPQILHKHICYDFCTNFIKISWDWKLVMQQHDGVSMDNMKEHHLATQQKNMKTTYNNIKRRKKMQKNNKTMQQVKLLIKIIEY